MQKEIKLLNELKVILFDFRTKKNMIFSLFCAKNYLIN